MVARIFHSKYEELKKDVYDTGVLGKVITHVHVVEFQKRGLPHVHMLIIIDENEKLNSPEDCDRVVRAKIPNEQELELYNAMVRHMTHGRCRRLNPSSPCIKHGGCKKSSTKQFSSVTLQGSDSYLIYQRRYDGRSVLLNKYSDV